MRKDRRFTKRSLKTMVAMALAASLAIPVVASPAKVSAEDAGADEPTTTLARLLDFNEGLKEYNDDETLKFDVVKTEDVYVYKVGDEIEAGDRVDANNLLIMGNGGSAYYKLYTISNQPCTFYDSERGTVLYMGKTINLDAVVKTKSAAVAGDDAATEKLDADLPVPEGEDKTIQEAMRVPSELQFNNPLKDNTDKYTVSMWLKIPTVDGVENALAGSWHYVTVTVDGDKGAYYLDGKATDNAAVVDGVKGWIASGDVLRIGGDTDGAKALAGAFGIVDANAAIMIDDLAFHTAALSAEQAEADYTAATTKATPVANKLSVADFKDINTISKDAGMPGIKGTATEVFTSATDTVNGVSEDVINIPENKKASTSTGAFIANPFAGKDLEGATISFWTKQAKRSGKTSTGDETTPIMSLIDESKMINHLKAEAKGEAWSMLSLTSDGVAAFVEGFSNDQVKGKLKNQYTYTMGKDDYKHNVMEWYNITLVMTNGGIDMYVNGKLTPNMTLDDKGESIAAGIRFSDGYFQRLADEKDKTTKYNIFGGSNNQYATSLMSYLKYNDVKFFLGYVPNTAAANVKSNPTSFAGIRTFDMALSAEQVEALYKDSTVYDDKGQDPKPPVGDVVLGDADGNGKVELADAAVVLKAALNITQLDEAATKRADADKNGKVELADASLVLKAALNIITLE